MATGCSWAAQMSRSHRPKELSKSGDTSAKNPLKGWYGLKKGLRGRFAMYVPPVLEALGLAEVEHNPKNNRIRAL